MRNSKTNGKTLKKAMSKCKKRFIAYSDTQFKYAHTLEADNQIIDIQANVKLNSFPLGDCYTTDFLCKKADNTYIAIETIEKKYLLKPMHLKLLENSRHYWLARGVDWKLIIGEKKNEKE